MSHLPICTIDPELQLKINRFKKMEINGKSGGGGGKNCGIIMKVDRATQTIVEDEEIDDESPSSLLSSLTTCLPSQSPRFVLLSLTYTHPNPDPSAPPRISYPLIFIFYTPRDSPPDLQMMYAGTKNSIQNDVIGGCKVVVEVRDVEELEDEKLVLGKIK